ncbi:MAG: STN domain-containing protein [Verrucomicrobia bacterium]|nr:STN domain-containing protein [Verrucomicrobiota bacterium]MDA1068814.1 STN domain-containing protein [Verrucomicrobiota bacterium]
MQPDRQSFTHLILVLGFVFSFLLTGCSEKETTRLDIPEGFATNTLKEFARQANVEIIFDPQSVYGVKTHAVSGEHEPRSALRIMLKDTPLTVDFDAESGAYAVIRIKLSGNFNCAPLFDTIAGISYTQFLIQN